MNILRIGILVAALAVAGVVALLVRNFLVEQSTAQQEVREAVPQVQVLVAAQDLPAGTVMLGGELEGHLRWQPWPEEALNPEWVALREGDDATAIRAQFAGATVSRGFLANEPITPNRVIKEGEKGFMAAALTPGMRAVSVPVTAASAASGFIVPGSIVDVILTQRTKAVSETGGSIETRTVSETVLEGVKVLAVDQRVDDVNQAAVVGKTVTVEVNPKQAEVLEVAKAIGQISFALRSLRPPEQEIAGDPFTSELEVSRFLSRESGERSPVVVAKRPLKAGTLLQDADFEWRTLPADEPLDGYFVRGQFSEASLRGSLLTEQLGSGKPLRRDNVVLPSEQGFLTAALGTEMRAISVAISDVSGVSGYIAPGDRVDVLLTHQLNDTGPNPPLAQRRFTETLLSNVRVLAIEQTVDESSGKPVVGKTATLEVTPKQAEAAFLAVSMGTLSLALRGETAQSAGGADVTFTSDLEISRAAWELVRGLNRYGPGKPPQGAIGDDDGEVRKVSTSGGRGSRAVIKVYRSVGSSTVSVSR